MKQIHNLMLSSATARDYVALTKPRIIVLLLITALTGMVLAAEGLPSGHITAAVLIGGSLAAGGASAVNHWLDRDLDRLMQRTRNRPVASGRVGGYRALLFGLVLLVISFVVLAVGAHLSAAILAAFGGIFYIVVYTMWLKRNTMQNIVIGGAAGAVPPLVGWAAVTGSLGLAPLFLFAIIFFWTPPHFWALALLMRDDYAKAGVPMMPVVVGDTATMRSILLYSVMLVALTLLFVAPVSSLGIVYFISASVLGIGLVGFAVTLVRRGTPSSALRLYKYSILYLALLFAAIMVDASLA